MERLKRLFVIVIVAMVSLIGLAGCGDPYKNMTLNIDNGSEMTIVYDHDDDIEDTFTITANVNGAGSGVDTGVVFISHDTNVVVADGDMKVNGNVTTQKFRIVTTGETYISVNTLEGNLSENVNVNIIAYADSISLIHQNETKKSLPIVKGNSTDLTKIASNKGEAFINFEPAYATVRDVVYEVFTDIGGTTLVEEGDSTYIINGNNITFSDKYNKNNVYIRAKYGATPQGGGVIQTGLTKVTLLDPINIDEYKLMYSYAKHNSDAESVVELIEVDKSTTSDVDYQIYLADQYAGDADNDSKNIFLVKDIADVNETFVNVLESDSKISFTKVDKSTNNHVYSYASTINGKATLYGTTISRPGFVICNGSGEGNNDVLYFNINYAGFEEYFEGIEISLRVTIDAFPAGVVIGLDDSVNENYWYNQAQSIDVYASYVNMLGTSFYVKVLNNAHETVTSQYAYVGVMGFMDNNEYVKLDSINPESNEEAKGYGISADSYFTIYDSQGHIVTPYTKVKSGSQLFIKYNPQKDVEGFFDNADFVLYARSILDPSITTFNLSTDADGYLDQDIYTGKYYFKNTINEMLLGYSVNLEDIVIQTGSTSPYNIVIKNAAGVKYPEATNIPSAQYDLEYILNGNGLVCWDANIGDEKSWDSVNKCYKVRLIDTSNRVGTATLTVIAPNGSYDTIEINVTINPSAGEFKLLVGNMVLADRESQTLQINVNTIVDVAVLFDDVAYSGMLPYGFVLRQVRATRYVSYNNFKLTSGDMPTPSGTTETHEFQLSYVGEADPIGIYTINIVVVRPVNYITRSHANVEMFYSESVKNITDTAVGNIAIDQDYVNASGEEVKYINVANQTKSVVTFDANPSNSTLNLANVKLELGFNNEWQQVNLSGTSNAGGFDYKESLDYGYDNNGDITCYRYRFGENSQLIELQKLRIELDPTTNNNNFKLYVEDIVYKEFDSASGEYVIKNTDIKLKVRLTYTQEHDLVLTKRYYIGGGYNGSTKKDTFYLYTDVNNPETSRVTYVGGYKFVSAYQNETINGESGSFKTNDIKNIIIGGITFTINASSDYSYYYFDYNKYKIELPVVVNYLVKAPVLTHKIEFNGVEAVSSQTYLKTLNKNQLNEKFKFEFTYLASPQEAEIAGLLFRYDYQDVYGTTQTSHISQLYYQNLLDGSYTRTPEEGNKYRVVGAITTESFTINKGLLIYVDYLTKKITAVITCNPNLLIDNPTLNGYVPTEDEQNAFIGLMNENYNVINLNFVSVDSYAKTPVFSTLRFELRTGSPTNPYTISSVEDFDNIRNDLTSSYQLVSDLDFKDVDSWTPINNFTGNLFSGTFDNYDDSTYRYTIKNFRMSLMTADGLGGIFGSAQHVSFQNIIFENFFIEYDADECVSADSSVHVGFLVGKAENCSIKHCDFIDNTELSYEDYNVGKIADDTQYGVVINDSTTILTYYVGGIFGSHYVTSTGVNMIQVDVNIKVYNKVNSASTMYFGGIVGQGSVNMEGYTFTDNNGTYRTDDDTTTTINNNINVVVYAKNSASATGGIIGDATGVSSKISDVEIESYIIGGSDLGGLIGSATSVIEFNTSTFSGYLEGKDNIGGFAGFASQNVTLTSCKVQFKYRNIDTMKYRSGIVGENNLGGLVGFANAKFTANFSSVMTYVDYSTATKYTVLNRLNANDVSSQTEAEKKDYYYGDIVVLSASSDINMGGFVAIANAGIEVNSGYFNAHAVVHASQQVYFGGVAGNLQNGDGSIQNGGLTIKHTAANGDILYNKAEGTIIGGFVGVIATGVKLHTYTINSDSQWAEKSGIQTSELSVDDYNIQQSYTLLKHAQLGNTLVAINNFAGHNEQVEQETYKKKLFSISLKYYKGEFSRYRIFVLRYKTPLSTTYDTFAFNASSLGVDGLGKLSITLNFGSSLPCDGANFANIGDTQPFLALTWKTDTNNVTANIEFSYQSACQSMNFTEIYYYAPQATTYKVPNVLALNSFYDGYTTKVRVFDEYAYSKEFVEYTFDADYISDSSVNLNGKYYSFTFDYFTQKAIATDTSDENTYYTTFDNLAHDAYVKSKIELNVQITSITAGTSNGEVYPYNASYSQYAKYVRETQEDSLSDWDKGKITGVPTIAEDTTIAAISYNTDDGILPSTINDAYDGSTINDDSITSLATIYPKHTDETVVINNHAFVVEQGTALGSNYIFNKTVYNTVDDTKSYKWYFNVSSDKNDILGGFPIPFQSYLAVADLQNFLKSNIPLLVVDIPSKEINGQVTEEYQNNVDIQNKVFMLTYYGVDNNGVSDSRNLVNIKDIINISTIPELANENINYSSSNLSVLRIVDENKILLIGEGEVVITATSELSGLSIKFDIVVIAYDHINPYWQINSMNNSMDSTGANTYETFIPIDDGDVINFDNGYTGQYVFGIKFEFTKSDIVVNEIGRTKEDIVRALNISGNLAITMTEDDEYYSIEIDSLTHSISCSLLSSVNIKQTLYLKYKYNNVTYTYYIDEKTTNYSFVEAVYGITGVDEFNIYTLGTNTFSVVINCDSEAPKLNLSLSLADDEYGKTFRFNDLKNNQVFNLSDYSLGYLKIEVVSIGFDLYSKLKTYTFRVSVDESEQILVQKEYNYNFRFVVDNEPDFYHNVKIGLLPQNVESIYINHYTNVFFTANDIETGEGAPSLDTYNSYKYPSDIIIPGYTSLLQVNLYPYFGRYDYITVESDLSGVSIGQVIEVYNQKTTDIENQYSWYEYYSKGQSVLVGANGIVTVAKYSYKDASVDPSIQLGYNGTLFFALSADTRLSSHQVNITVKGYIKDSDEVMFSDAATLKIEARPTITISSEQVEIMFGDVVNIDITKTNADGDFTASLKVDGVNYEYIDVLGSIVSEGKGYKFKVNDSTFVYNIFHQYMYKEITLKLTISKVINEMEVYAESEVKFLLIPFMVSGIDVNLDGLDKIGSNFIVDYFQSYEVLITANATYSKGYSDWLNQYHSYENIDKQLEVINTQIKQNISNFSVIKQGTSVSRTALLYPGRSTYSGDFSLNYDTDYGTLDIRFIKTEVSNFIWADIGIEYTIAGVSVVPYQYAKYIYSDYFSVSVYTNSSEDTPDPITSVEEFKNMEAGVNYILMTDLYLALWEPISADFKSLDGNGYVITLVSFADVKSMSVHSGEYGYNIGIFSQISADTTIKNLTIEINPSPASMDFTQDKDYDTIVNEAIKNDYTIPSAAQGHSTQYVNSLNVDISSLKTQTNFGVLAGTNLGTITNVSIVNNATELRTIRNNALKNIQENSNSNYINLEDADDFSDAITEFENIESTDTIKVSYMFENKDETTSRSNKISLLVGTNAGFITNSNAENVSISGEDYVAGLVGQNMGKISSSFFKGGNIIGDSTTKANSGNGGLVALNRGEIYYSYVEGKTRDNNITNLSLDDFSSGEYLGSGIITNSYAGGFAYLNSGKINNCYAKILVSGIYASGFVYKCDTEEASIEYCYSISNILSNATTNTPFLKRSNVINKANIKECYYLYDKTISNLAEDIAESIASKEFKEYSTFASYAFNSDYYDNADILDGVWFIPGGNYAETTKKYFKQSEYSDDSPQLVAANQRTLSIRYMSGAEEEGDAYVYSWVNKVTIKSNDVSILRGSTLNPLTINTASGFNNAVMDGTDNRKFRLINDISFTVDDEVATTYSSTFTGKLDGNGMTIGNLRISADEIADEEITKLGLFKEIKGAIVRDADGNVTATTVGEESKYAVVKNLNVEVSQINGMTINLVGVLAGQITDAKIYNVSVSGENYVVQGLNSVGAIAGRVLGDTDMVNISSNVSIRANYFYQYNAFSKEWANTDAIQKFHSYMNYSDVSDDNANIKYVSYAGGIAGIINVDEFSESDDTQINSIREEMYRLRRLSVAGQITIEGEVVGGLFGYLSSESNVSDCDLIVSDNMALKGSRIVGGFVGHNEGAIKNCTVVNSNQDDIDLDIEANISKYDNATQNYDIGVQNLFQGNAMFIGGIAGANFGGTIEKTYNRVNVACGDSLYAGGIVGLSVKGVYSDIYVTSSVYSFSAMGGMIGIAVDPTKVDVDATDKEEDILKKKLDILSESKALGFFMSNTISNMPQKAVDIAENEDNVASINNVVLSNIWRYSHLNDNRSTLSMPNAQPASLGMLAGYVYGLPDMDTENDESNTMLAEAYVQDILGGVTTFADRVVTDNIYYKQTYTYKTLKTSNKVTIKEIGNQNDNALLNILGINFDSATTTPNQAGESSIYTGSYLPYSTDNDNIASDEITKYTTIISNNSRYISGKFRPSANDMYDTDNTVQSYYVFSRMTAYGSLRSLSEIYQRKYDYTEANKFYENLGSAYNTYRENVDNITAEDTDGDGTIDKGIDVDGDGTIEEDAIARYKALSIYSNWDAEKWYGVGLTAEGNRAEDEYLYPEYKNATVDEGVIFIYSFADFESLFNKGDDLTDDDLFAEYVLMNDIYWNPTGLWKPIGTKMKPFRGTLRSAKIGDVDGTNKVTENRTFTIFNVNFTNSNVDSTYITSVADNGGGALGIFGYTTRATFTNFNVHTTGINTSSKEYEYVGTLVGCATEFCKFSNITLFGSSTTISPVAEIKGKDDWASSLVERDTSSTTKVKVLDPNDYYSYAEILNAIGTSQATITTTATAFVGGLVGYAGKITIDAEAKESYYASDGLYYASSQSRSGAINVYNLKLEVSGNGSASGYHHYVGGLFGYVSVIVPVNLRGLGGYTTTDSYKYFTADINNVNIVANFTTNASSYALQHSSAPEGVCVGGYAGYINSNGLSINGVRINKVNIGSTINPSKIDSNGMVAVGSLVGYAGELTIDNLLVDSGVTIESTSDKNSHIGGLVGYAEFVSMSNAIINEDITLNISTENTDIKYYGGIFGSLVSAGTISNIIANNTITLNTNSSTGYISGGLAGKVSSSGTTIQQVVLNNVVQTTGSAVIAGGLVGAVYEAGVIKECYVGGTISQSTPTAIGGLIGVALTNNNALVQLITCVSNVNITETISTSNFVIIGGLVGLSGYSSNGLAADTTRPVVLWIQNSYNSGNLFVGNATSNKIAVGGILGLGTLLVQDRVYNIGTISFGYSIAKTNDTYTLINSSYGTSANNIGGVVGKYIYTDDNTVINSLTEAYYNKDLMEVTNSYGNGLTTEAMLAKLQDAELIKSWITSYSDASMFNDCYATSTFVQSLQAIGTKANPIEISEELSQEDYIDKYQAIIFKGNTITAGLTLSNTSLYCMNNTAMDSNPAFTSIDSTSFVYGLKINPSSAIRDYIVEQNHGYLVNWEVNANGADIIGSNTGVVIGWNVSTNIRYNNPYIIANNYSGAKSGTILYSKFEVDFNSNIPLFTMSTASYVKEDNVINNSVIQCHITYKNSYLDSSSFTSTANYLPFIDCIKDAYASDGSYCAPYYINRNHGCISIATYTSSDETEYNITAINNSNYDFVNVYTWLDSTKPVTLMALEKDHFNDKELKSNSWKYEADNYNGSSITAVSNVVEVSTTEELVYALYKYCGNNSYTIKYNGDTVVDLAGKIWTPISEFKATLDMGGAIIDNVMIISNSTYAGFINVLNGGTIKNATFRNLHIVSSSSSTDCYIGSIARRLHDNSTVSQVGVEGFTPYTRVKEISGALVGLITSDTAQISDAYVAVEYVDVEYVADKKVYPLAKAINTTNKVPLTNYYAYAYYKNTIQSAPFLDDDFDANLLDTTNGNSLILTSSNYTNYVGRLAEDNLPYFDFISVWNSTGNNGGSIESNFGLPRFNTTTSLLWEDVVTLDGVSYTQNSNVTISSGAELAQFAKWLNSGNYFTGGVTLASDIDLGEVPAMARAVDGDERTTILWTPIGTKTNQFRGTFDGQGHYIYGLSVAGTNVAGLFGYISGATIKNVKFSGNNTDGTYNERVGARISITPTSNSVGYAGIVVGLAQNSTIQDIVVKALSADGKYYRSYVTLNNKERAYIGGIAGSVGDSTLFNNLVEGCLYDGDSATTLAQDKAMITVSTKFAGGKPVAMGGIVGVIAHASASSVYPYAMSNVVKNVNIVNKSNMDTYDYGSGSTTLQYYGQVYNGENESNIFFGTGGIAGMSRYARLVSNNVQTYFSVDSTNKALGGIVGQVYGGTVQECAVLLPNSNYYMPTSGTKGLVIGYGAKAEALNLYAVTAQSESICGDSYTPSKDTSITETQKQQEKLKDNWYESASTWYKISDTFRLYDYAIVTLNTASGVVDTFESSYNIETGYDEDEEATVVKLSASQSSYITGESTAWLSGKNITFSVQTGETQTITYGVSGTYMFNANTEEQGNWFAVNSDYYTKAESKQATNSLLFNWSSTGDILLGGTYYTNTPGEYVSKLSEHKHFNEWLYSLLRFRPNIKEMAFNLNLDFSSDTGGKIDKLVSTQDFPFGSRTRSTTISGNNINLDIDSSENNVGLFGYGINLTFENVEDVTGSVKGNYRVGALIGYADNMLLNEKQAPQMLPYKELTNIEVDVEGQAVVGGLIGEGYFIDINSSDNINCAVKASSYVELDKYYNNSSYGYGWSSNTQKDTIVYEINSTTLGGVDLNKDYTLDTYIKYDTKYSGAVAGGLIGLSRYNVVVQNVNVYTTLEAQYGYVGGFIGNHNSVEINSIVEGCLVIEQSQYLGSINSLVATPYKGGLIGYTDSESNAFTANKNGHSVTYSLISNCQAGESGTTDSIIGSNRVAGITPQFKGIIQHTTNNFKIVDTTGYYTGEDSTINKCPGSTAGIVSAMQGKIEYCVNNGEICSNNKFIGGIVGYLCGTSKSNTNNGKVTSQGSHDVHVLGGIVGYVSLNDCTINGSTNVVREIVKCTNNGDVVSLTSDNNTYAGGIVGYATKGTKIGVANDIIEDSYASTGNTNTGNISSKSYAGGIVGYANNTLISLLAFESNQRVDNIEISYNKSETGTIKGFDGNEQYGKYVGGIVGMFNSLIGGTISNNINESNVGCGEEESYVGGIIGKMTCGNVTNNSNLGDINGVNYVGGIIGGMEVGDIVEDIEQIEISVSDNNSQGDVLATGDYVGGILGNLTNNETDDVKVNVANNTFVGSVNGEDGEAIGNCEGNNIYIDNVLFEEVTEETPEESPEETPDETPEEPTE